MWQEGVDNHRCGVEILVCTGDEHILGCRTIIFPIFPTNYNYRKKGKEMMRNTISSIFCFRQLYDFCEVSVQSLSDYPVNNCFFASLALPTYTSSMASIT